MRRTPRKALRSPRTSRRDRADAANFRQEVIGMLFGDLVSRLSNGPNGASYCLLWGRLWDTNWTYEVNLSKIQKVL